MSLRPHPIGPIPEQTARVAHAAFPKGNPYLTLRDHLGTIFQDDDFATLFPTWGYPGLPVAPGFSHAHAVPRKPRGPSSGGGRPRPDRLEVPARSGVKRPGLRFFRAERISGSITRWGCGRPLTGHIAGGRALGWLPTRGQQRTDSTHVLAAIRVLNRLELVAETLRAALNAATVAPTWLQGVTPLAWYERYGKRIEQTRLPQEQAQRDAYAQTVGEDGYAFWTL